MTRKQPKRRPRPGVVEYGRTELHYAAVEPNAERVRALIRAGADVDAPDDNGWTALHFAAQSRAAEVCQVLLSAGATVAPRDAHGNTPLARAVSNSQGEGDVIAVLRRFGADPTAENDYGVSPVTRARRTDNVDLARFFSDLP